MEETPRRIIKNLTKPSNPFAPSPYIPQYTSEPQNSTANTQDEQNLPKIPSPTFESPKNTDSLNDSPRSATKSVSQTDLNSNSKILEDFSDDENQRNSPIQNNNTVTTTTTPSPIMPSQPITSDQTPIQHVVNSAHKPQNLSISIDSESPSLAPKTLELNDSLNSSTSTPPKVTSKRKEHEESPQLEEQMKQWADSLSASQLLTFPQQASLDDSIISNKETLLESVKKLREMETISFENINLPYNPNTSVQSLLQEKAGKKLSAFEKMMQSRHKLNEGKISRKFPVKSKEKETSKKITGNAEGTIIGGSKNSTKKLPQMPISITKSIFDTYVKLPVNRESYQEIQKGLNVFFERMSKDLTAFSSHAHRKTIDFSDIECLMKRQRLINDKTSLEDLIHSNLPMECIEEIIPVAKAHNKVVPEVKHGVEKTLSQSTPRSPSKRSLENSQKSSPKKRKEKKDESPKTKEKYKKSSEKSSPKKKSEKENSKKKSRKSKS